MAPWLRLAIAFASGAGALWVARERQARAYAGELADLEQGARRPAALPPLADPAGLPAPVRRYLGKALPAGGRSLQLVRYEQRGALRTGLHGTRWHEFTATQVVAPERAAFLWSARVTVAPLLHLRVTDSLIRGVGSGRVALLSALPLAHLEGGMELSSGALHRFLAEAVWYPTALLPSAALRWSPIDDRCALATLTDGRSTVSLEFRFNAQDEVAGVYTPGRWGRFGGRYLLAPWEGRFGPCRMHQGVLVPDEAEAGWHLGGAYRPVWRGRVMSASLRFRRAVRAAPEPGVGLPS